MNETRKEKNIRRLKDMIAQGMRQSLTVRSQRTIYRYIYYKVIVTRRRGDEGFRPEQFPADDLIAARTRQILEYATPAETLWAWDQYRTLHKRG